MIEGSGIGVRKYFWVKVRVLPVSVDSGKR